MTTQEALELLEENRVDGIYLATDQESDSAIREALIQAFELNGFSYYKYIYIVP